jgi:DNA-binding transcriptional regulator LsrR (DeoR family)
MAGRHRWQRRTLSFAGSQQFSEPLRKYCRLVTGSHPPSHQQIARALNVSGATVTRLKKDARKLNLIQIVYFPPQVQKLERGLHRRLRRHGICRVLVTEGDRIEVGHRAARLFEEIARDGATVVLDGGKSVACFIEALEQGRLSGVEIIPLVADPASYESSSYELMTRMATKYPVRVHCGKLPYWRSRELNKIARQVQKQASRADFIVLGVGPWNPSFTALEFVKHLGLNSKDLHKGYRDAVSAVVGYCAVGSEGQRVSVPEFEKKLPRSLSFSAMRALAATSRCTSMLLASGREKADPVLAAVRARACNTLVLDGELASHLLERLSSGV